MKVHKVYAKKNAIWPFTVVGRPPQEDTSFGQLIHEITGRAVQQEIPGLKAINAVDAAGVHPLLLAVGSERYTPFLPVKQPAELLTIANHILGTGQLSLAKFLFITADESDKLDVNDIAAYFQFVLERIDLNRDIHFYTNTSIDTLDYSGTGLNTGSKVVLAAYGDPVRDLAKEVPAALRNLHCFADPRLVMPGIVALRAPLFIDYTNAVDEIAALNKQLLNHLASLTGVPVIVLCDDPMFVAEKLNNFLWVTFTRTNPSHDIVGIDSSTHNKHWGCNGPLVLDARIKPHHAPAMQKDELLEKRIDRLFEKGGSLYKMF